MIYNLKTQSKEAKEKLDSYIKGGVVIELNNVTKRSVKQNSYLHVVITYFAMELGYTLKESKLFLKKECPFVEDDASTADMTIVQMIDFTEWVVTYNQMHDIITPSISEWMENRGKIDKEIRKNQKFL